MNICGCLVHVTPERVAEAKTAIEDHAGVTIYADDWEGRLVVVVEDTADRLASEIIMDLHQIPGVVSLTLTYHHFEEPPSARPEERQSNAGGSIHDHI